MFAPRRRFLGWLGGVSVAGIAGAPTLLRAAPTAIPTSPDASRALADDHPLPLADTWDMSWTSRVTGKYRAVFDGPEIADGAPMVRAAAWADMYKEVYGVEKSEITSVLVLRHAAIDLVMNDAYWTRFNIGKENKLRDADGKKWAKANPISAQSRPNVEQARRYTLETFMANGGIVLACGWAFRFVASRIQKGDKLEAAEARTKALEQMVPGIILQPNGIFAVLRAQEAGCHFAAAS